MAISTPLVSVLVLTYNRSHLLSRAIASVLAQDFQDIEVIVLDDCSTDDTPKIIASFNDPRIRCVRNEKNVGSEFGDRALFRRFIYELMKGRYFIYLCDDDYWIPRDLLSRQVDMFRTHSDLSMVIGAQLSHFLTTPESYLGGSPENPITLSRESLALYFDFDALQSKTPHLSFLKGIHSKVFMTSDEFLESYSNDPVTKNHNIGGTLYSRDHFIRSGTLNSPVGAKWQAGYELLMGPALTGGVGYLNEPTFVTEIRTSNASFNRTQVEHYLDSITSIETAFKSALTADEFKDKRKFYLRARNNTIRNVTRAFLGNSVSIKRHGWLTMCSEKNISQPVTYLNALRVFLRNRIWVEWADLNLMFVLPHKAAAERKAELVAK